MSFEVGAAVAVVHLCSRCITCGVEVHEGQGAVVHIRVFSALGMGIVLGVAIQLALGRGSDAAKCALDWMSLVGTGYISLLKMLVMPLIFVAIVGAFTRTEATENLGKIGISVLVGASGHGCHRCCVRLGDDRALGAGWCRFHAGYGRRVEDGRAADAL